MRGVEGPSFFSFQGEKIGRFLPLFGWPSALIGSSCGWQRRKWTAWHKWKAQKGKEAALMALLSSKQLEGQKRPFPAVTGA